MTEFLTVGEIVNTQGIKGEVRVISKTDFPEARFKKGNVLTLFLGKEKSLELTIDGSRVHKNFQLLHFKGYPTINDVEKFRGGLLKVAEDALSDELLEDEFYYHEIIGLKVVDDKNNDLGEVKDIFTTGANDVWTVARPGKKDWYLPYIDDVVKDIDLEKGTVLVELMEGLMDEN